ncbi:helix-turn-helix domain-containing protein [Leadbetterella sp. DM7]|uniref:helix-turn-helix domain-containing protein n=1 Tax=Leadbetterella sp. DM7 TaxID=3235085 RepID=UPI00349E5545
MDLYIKNMVCPRCIAAVEDLLREQNIPVLKVGLGHAVLAGELHKKQVSKVESGLKKLGFELLDDKRKQLVEQVKNIIIRSVHHTPEILHKKNLSDLLSEELGQDYKHISTVFSELTGTTIEKFQIRHKIERVKELIVYDQLSLKEIAFRMGYSSEAYLSNQFKKVTGFTPSHFKKTGEHERMPIDQLL